ncbi:MAG: hypothetical protein EZS28_003099 [Streblomastix strix]|uniref:Uncharacterized protein n=1 Tax=Streblomastix strix TaxID=222440 RepID=A0A5J4X3Q1_9EUKA|nr:MAG: hypothetical protein EZS28_003099 [Streblomastix strix]
MENRLQQFASHLNNLGRERYDVRRTEDPRVYPTDTTFLFGQKDLENTSNKVQQISYNYSGLRIGSELTRDTIVYVLKDLFKYLEYKMQLQTPLKMHLLQNQQLREQEFIASALVKNHGEKQATQIISKQMGGARVAEGDVLQQSTLGDVSYLFPQETLALPLSLPIISTQPFVEAEFINDHENAKGLKSKMQKDCLDVEPHEETQNSSMTTDSERTASAEAQK